MRIAMRLGIVAVIIVVAITAALPFRKTPTTHEESDGNAATVIERRMQGGAHGWSSRVTSPVGTQPLRVPTAATGSTPETKQDIPELPPSYHRSFSPVGALLDPHEDRISQTDSGSLDELQLLDDLATPATARALTHKIADGDTLASLAEKYLGDANRWQELFEHNRAMLVSPELLPIGRLLEIPPRESKADQKPIQTDPAPPLAPIPRGAFRRE